MTTQTQPSEKSLKRMRNYVEKYWQKSGTSPHPTKEVTDAVEVFVIHPAALHFARQLVENRGWVNDEDLNRVRRAGYGDGEIAEIVAVVAWKTFANYFNHVAGTEIDFPEVAAA